jgi:hypothetical protein
MVFSTLNRPSLCDARDQHLGGLVIADVQVHPRLQECPAKALGFDLGQFALEVGFDVR